ncbi:MAG: hypothetical protein GY786_03760 [Proteobacteria bacterium]|nr:hypothetical protein [Pseudomonadota bacterium]
MEIHRQTCQGCGSRNMKNIIVREESEADKIFAQCHDCGALVARYVIGQKGYYHSGKGFESFLRGLNRGGSFDSGKNIFKDFTGIKDRCEEKFARILKIVDEKEKSSEK